MIYDFSDISILNYWYTIKINVFKVLNKIKKNLKWNYEVFNNIVLIYLYYANTTFYWKTLKKKKKLFCYLSTSKWQINDYFQLLSRVISGSKLESKNWKKKKN